MTNDQGLSHLRPWDYLIVTASNAGQAEAYRTQLELRRSLGLLTGVREVLVVADPEGRRIGSGGSTLYCLMEVLRREGEVRGGSGSDAREILRGLRVLIVHAGGDSRRLPAYGPCGKILVPVPGESDSILPVTLFDRQIPTYFALPAHPDGQVVITSGDVLLRFDPAEVRYHGPGVIALACHADPERARNHGVFCRGKGEEVRLFLQKPSPDRQQACGAINAYGQALLDIGVMHFDAATAARLLSAFGYSTATGEARLSGEFGEEVQRKGLDFYREICCALGTEATLEHYINSVRESGSSWDTGLLERLFATLRATPFAVQLLPRCDFLDFGTSRKIIESGSALLREDLGVAALKSCIDVNNDLTGPGQMNGLDAWVEGCRIRSTLSAGGDNVIVGVDIEAPLTLPAGACLDVIPGRGRGHQVAWFVRCYGVGDTFKDTAAQGATFCGLPVLDWLSAVGAGPHDIWPEGGEQDEQSLWTARLFPAVTSHEEYRAWLWMYEPQRASEEQRCAWRSTERYSMAEIAVRTDHELFFSRREEIRARRARRSLRQMFRPDSGFSGRELGYALRPSPQRGEWVSNVIAEARRHADAGLGAGGLDALVLPRILHTLGTSLLNVAGPDIALRDLAPGLGEHLPETSRAWMASHGLAWDAQMTVRAWAERAAAVAFESVGRTILTSEPHRQPPPRSSLRTDEIVWGRAPARLDTGGGWTDTPPYALEHGGCVVNTAIDLNGQPPIQAYARVIETPMIRISSIDLGVQIQISELADLLDYRTADSQFGLAKAALALSGFMPGAADWPERITLDEMLRRFGGGIELTTLAAIPKGSGLGTSSIMGAVILAVIHRVLGRTLSPRELFHEVLRLEQALTTGGGWQDQIGGAVGGAKIISADRGLVPDARVHYLPPDVIDPRLNQERTVLYYTGVTRLAKNILEQVVGRYLSRDRAAMSTLARIRSLAPVVAESMSRKDYAAFGRGIAMAWHLNKELDPNSTNDEVEGLMERVAPHVEGAKLLGAGGGGFMLMACRTPRDAEQVREMLTREPPNPRARFFDFSVNPDGLVVTVC